MKILLCAVLLLALVQAEKKTVDFFTSDPKYSATYEFTKDTLTVELFVTNWNRTSWALTNGSQGLWVGLGYGNTVMNADVTFCSYTFYNLTTDTFVCKDGQVH
jgi:hypothetical protein